MLNNPEGVTDSESWLAPEIGSGSYSLACRLLSDVAASDSAYRDGLVTARWSI
jgi:hypothetical protein